VVRDKTSDIAILKTMGSRALSISTIFAVQGGLIGLVGTSLGVVAGVLLAKGLTRIVTALENFLGIDLLAADVYFISDLPTFIDPTEVGQITLLALVLALLAALVPAVRAARIEPAKALRHD
jgi:lipoprotein-releasing system permease protein